MNKKLSRKVKTGALCEMHQCVLRHLIREVNYNSLEGLLKCEGGANCRLLVAPSKLEGIHPSLATHLQRGNALNILLPWATHLLCLYNTGSPVHHSGELCTCHSYCDNRGQHNLF